MADSLIEQCSKLNIEGVNEEEVIDLEDGDDAVHDEKLSLRLVGRLLTEKPVNFDALKRTMQHAWSLKDGVVIRALESNLFLFQFFHWRDRDKVFDGRPWCFEQRLLVLQEINKDIQPSNMALNFSPFWVRLYNLPYSCRSDGKIAVITRSIGKVIEVEEDFLDLSPYRKIRVLIDCAKPLKRFQNVRVKGDVMVRINIKYDRLRHFCFLCGLMNHTEKDCSYVNDEEKEKGNGWGMFIRASPRKGLTKHNDEVSGLKSNKALFCTKPKIVVGPTPSTLSNPDAVMLCDKVAADARGEIAFIETSPCKIKKGTQEDPKVGNKSLGFSKPNTNEDLGSLVSEEEGTEDDKTCPGKTLLLEDAPTPGPVACATVPTFNMGVGPGKPKKKVSIRRKMAGRGSGSQDDNNGKEIASETLVSIISHSSFSKRKFFDTDVEMEDCDVAQKRSCSGNDSNV